MSLRDKNKEIVIVPSGLPKGNGTLSGTLRNAAALPTQPDPRVLAALEKASMKQTAQSGNGRVGLVFDATGSREAGWPDKKKIQQQMFETINGTGQMTLRMVHFGGGEITDHGWVKDSQAVTTAMNNVECRSGGTQIIGSLEKFIADNPKDAAASIIFVGDSFEEPYFATKEDLIKILGPLTEKLAAQGTKVFTFLEGQDSHAEQALRVLSERTGGAFAKFGDDLSLLKDLCSGVALMSVGGAAALRKLQSPQAQQLLLTRG